VYPPPASSSDTNRYLPVPVLIAPPLPAPPAAIPQKNSGWLWGGATAVVIGLAAALAYWLLPPAPNGKRQSSSTTTTVGTSVPVTVVSTTTSVDARAMAAQVQALIAQGDGFLVSGNTAGALSAFSKAIAIDPNNRRAFEGLRRAREMDQSTSGRIVLHYSDPDDQRTILDLNAWLSETLKPLQVMRPEFVRVRSTGDVRYFFPDDEKLAVRVKDATEFALAQSGYKIPLKLLRRDAANYPNAQQGTVEVWLPALGRSPYAQRSK
jgi:hypothetical protein